MEKTRKTYITSRKEIDRLVAEAVARRNHKRPAVLRGIRFPKGYRIPRPDNMASDPEDMERTDRVVYIRFEDCDMRGIVEYGELEYLLYCKNCDLRGQRLTDFLNIRMVNCDMRKCDMTRMQFVFMDGSVSDELRDCDLRGADFSGCDFDGLSVRSKLYKQLDKTTPMACPATGKYTAYKRLAGGWIAKLEIPAHAQRSSATNKGKCRASEAVVKRIYRHFADGSVVTATEGESIRGRLRYVVGETVKPDGFDTNRFHVCAPGIHHFMTYKEAEDYNL